MEIGWVCSVLRMFRRNFSTCVIFFCRHFILLVFRVACDLLGDDCVLWFRRSLNVILYSYLCEIFNFRNNFVVVV